MSTRWQQFVIRLGELDHERVERVVEEAGALSVTLSDAGDDPVLEPGVGETPLWSSTVLTALFDANADLASLPTAIAKEFDLGEPPPCDIEMLGDRAWEREWLKDFSPMRFGRRLVVCPGDMDPPDDDSIVVSLDPGLAFGTGTHPTTAMCLEWLDAEPLSGKTVLDFGCGSGILAIAALKLGATSGCGTDIDPQALTASADNARRNSVSLELYPPDDVPPGPYDVVVANILAGPLAELANHISEYVKSGGRLALSGILQEQAVSVRKAYEDWISFDEPQSRSQEGQTWVRLTGTRH